MNYTPGTRVKPRHRGTFDARNGHTRGTITEPPYPVDRFTRAVEWEDGRTNFVPLGEIVAV